MSLVASGNCRDFPAFPLTLLQLDGAVPSGPSSRMTWLRLNLGYDTTQPPDILDELGCCGVIGTIASPLRAGQRWVIEPTDS